MSTWRKIIFREKRIQRLKQKNGINIFILLPFQTIYKKGVIHIFY